MADRARFHWQIERELREDLLASVPESRADVTRDVYNRLFELVPWHDANVADASDEDTYEKYWFRLYGPLTRPNDVLVDVGCGRGGVVRTFAPAVRESIGIDVSDTMVELANRNKPSNARFIAGDILRPPLPAKSADFVVSRQVMEHLHPDDVPAHLRAIRDILRPGGRFLIETPSRLTGPWDISRGFTETATGFHLREYTNRELGLMLRDAGFSRIRGPGVPARVLEKLGRARRRAYVPLAVKAALERVLLAAPPSVRPKIAGPLVVREVTLVAERR